MSAEDYIQALTVWHYGQLSCLRVTEWLYLCFRIWYMQNIAHELIRLYFKISSHLHEMGCQGDGHLSSKLLLE